MATAAVNQPIISIIDAASKAPLDLVKANSFFRIKNDVVVCDLYRTKDHKTAILIVHKQVPIEDLEAILIEGNGVNNGIGGAKGIVSGAM